MRYSGVVRCRTSRASESFAQSGWKNLPCGLHGALNLLKAYKSQCTQLPCVTVVIMPQATSTWTWAMQVAGALAALPPPPLCAPRRH